jgi:hypothetical protein
MQDNNEVSRIEKLLLKERQIFEIEYERDKYAVPHDYDFNKYFERTFSCLYDVYEKSKYVRVAKQLIRDMIRETESKGSAKRDIDAWISVGAAGDNCLDSYTNHLSDYDCYYFNGEGTIALNKDSLNKWKLFAKINNGRLHSA